MNANQEVDKALAHQASEWVTVLRRKTSREERAAFAQWLKVSPRNIREFLAMAAIEQELHQVDGALESGDADISNVVALKDAPTPIALPRSRGREWKWAVAAGVAAIALLAVFFSFKEGSYATAVGEQRAIELEDGSIVHLNTHSKVQVRMSTQGRDIELVAGEALFKVHRDPARPFRVHSRGAVIQALGTEFNVYRRPYGTTVSVLEGAVQIASAKLGAGEEARIATDGALSKRKAADLTKAVAWRQRRLVFDQDSLADMVREFNRYNNAPQFRLEGSDVALRHYTGVFDADDPESLIQLLSAEPGLAVERARDTITVRAR